MGLELAQRFQNIQERVRRMRVINKDLELSFGRNHFESAGHLWRFGETDHRFAQTDAERVGGGKRGQRIGDIESSDQRNAHEITFAAGVELIRGPAKFYPIIRSTKIGVRSHPESYD